MIADNIAAQIFISFYSTGNHIFIFSGIILVVHINRGNAVSVAFHLIISNSGTGVIRGIPFQFRGLHHDAGRIFHPLQFRKIHFRRALEFRFCGIPGNFTTPLNTITRRVKRRNRPCSIRVFNTGKRIFERSAIGSHFHALSAVHHLFGAHDPVADRAFKQIPLRRDPIDLFALGSCQSDPIADECGGIRSISHRRCFRRSRPRHGNTAGYDLLFLCRRISGADPFRRFRSNRRRRLPIWRSFIAWQESCYRRGCRIFQAVLCHHGNINIIDSPNIVSRSIRILYRPVFIRALPNIKRKTISIQSKIVVFILIAVFNITV